MAFEKLLRRHNIDFRRYYTEHLQKKGVNAVGTHLSNLSKAMHVKKAF
jgi:hypothetical protein